MKCLKTARFIQLLLIVNSILRKVEFALSASQRLVKSWWFFVLFYLLWDVEESKFLKYSTAQSWDISSTWEKYLSLIFFYSDNKKKLIFRIYRVYLRILLITLLTTLIVNRSAVLKHWHIYKFCRSHCKDAIYQEREDNDPGFSFNHHDLYMLYTLRAIFLLRRRIASFLPSICFEKTCFLFWVKCSCNEQSSSIFN